MASSSRPWSASAWRGSRSPPVTTPDRISPQALAVVGRDADDDPVLDVGRARHVHAVGARFANQERHRHSGARAIDHRVTSAFACVSNAEHVDIARRHVANLSNTRSMRQTRRIAQSTRRRLQASRADRNHCAGCRVVDPAQQHHERARPRSESLRSAKCAKSALWTSKRSATSSSRSFSRAW